MSKYSVNNTKKNSIPNNSFTNKPNITPDVLICRIGIHAHNGNVEIIRQCRNVAFNETKAIAFYNSLSPIEKEELWNIYMNDVRPFLLEHSNLNVEV